MQFTKDELRLLRVSGPTWINMLRARQDRIISRMHSDYRAGSTDHLTSVAELVCVREQINEITSALKQNENLKE